MKTETKYNEATSTVIAVCPWDEPFSATVDVYHQKIELEMFPQFPHRAGDVAIRYGQNWTTVAHARRWAAAIVAACDIADLLAAADRLNAVRTEEPAP
jgi:hypothetical protein